MKPKNTKKQLRNKAKGLSELIRCVVNDKIEIPNNALIIDADILIDVFTKKRLELIRSIANEKPSSITRLAEITGRKKQAVDRDLRLLERSEIISFTKHGKQIEPKVNRRLLVLSLDGRYEPEDE